MTECSVTYVHLAAVCTFVHLYPSLPVAVGQSFALYFGKIVLYTVLSSEYFDFMSEAVGILDIGQMERLVCILYNIKRISSAGGENW